MCFLSFLLVSFAYCCTSFFLSFFSGILFFWSMVRHIGVRCYLATCYYCLPALNVNRCCCSDETLLRVAPIRGGEGRVIHRPKASSLISAQLGDALGPGRPYIHACDSGRRWTTGQARQSPLLLWFVRIRPLLLAPASVPVPPPIPAPRPAVLAPLLLLVLPPLSSPCSWSPPPGPSFSFSFSPFFLLLALPAA